MQVQKNFSKFQQQFNNFQSSLQQPQGQSQDQLIDFSQNDNPIFQKRTNLSYSQLSNQNQQYEFRQSSKERIFDHNKIFHQQDLNQSKQSFQTFYDQNLQNSTNNSQKHSQDARWNQVQFNVGKPKLVQNNIYKQNVDLNDDQQIEVIKDFAQEKKYFSQNKLSLHGFKQNNKNMFQEYREGETNLIDFSLQQSNNNLNQSSSQRVPQLQFQEPTYFNEKFTINPKRALSITKDQRQSYDRNIQNASLNYQFSPNQTLKTFEKYEFQNFSSPKPYNSPIEQIQENQAKTPGFMYQQQFSDPFKKNLIFQKTPGFQNEQSSQVPTLTPFYDQYKYNQPFQQTQKLFNQNKEQIYLDNQFIFQNGMSSEYKVVKLKSSKQNSKNNSKQNSKNNSAKKQQDIFQTHVIDSNQLIQDELFQLFTNQIEILKVLEAKKIEVAKRPDFRIIDLFHQISKMNSQISLELLNKFFQQFVGISPDHEDLKQFFHKYSSQTNHIEIKQFSLMFLNQSKINDSRLMNIDQPLQDDFCEQTNNSIKALLKAHLNATVSFQELKKQKLNLRNIYHSIELENDLITEQCLKNFFDLKVFNYNNDDVKLLISHYNQENCNSINYQQFSQINNN